MIVIPDRAVISLVGARPGPTRSIFVSFSGRRAAPAGAGKSIRHEA